MSACWATVLTLLACAAQDPGPQAPDPGSDERSLVIDAVRLAAERPGPAGDGCFAVVDPDRLVDCIEQVATRQVATDPEGAHGTCAKLVDRRPPLAGRDAECFFRVAEAADRPEWCLRAGDSTFNCQMHVFSRRLATWIPRDAVPGDFEARASARIEAAGLDPYDPRPWSAMYRWVLGGQRPLDRSSCAQAPDALRQEACAATAVAVFHDRLSHARDKGQDLCAGPLPPSLATTPDPALDAALTERRAGDLCDPDAVPAHPPGAGLPGSAP